MPARKKGGRKAPLSEVPGSEVCGEPSAPIRSLAEQQLYAKALEGLQGVAEWQGHDGSQAIAKRKRTEFDNEITIERDKLLQIVENAAANVCRGFERPAATGSSMEPMQALRSEMRETLSNVQAQLTEILADGMAKMQAEADTRTNLMLESLLHKVHEASKRAEEGATTAAMGHVMPEEAIESLRNEMTDNIDKAQAHFTQLLNAAMAKMQAESDRRAEAMLERMARKFHEASEQANKSAAAETATQVRPGISAIHRPQPQPTQSAQRTWADVTRTRTQAADGWTNVNSRKKKLKKHPRDQRRVLFVRNSQSRFCDPRDIMFDINKALAHARAHVTVRLINLKYTERGNLSGVLGEHACAEELLDYAPVVMPIVQKLDPAVIDVEKTERWRKLRVHGVALDRYMTESGLDIAREEIELMTGSELPYAPRWLKSDTLAERFDSGAIKRSTLVLTVKTKRAADAILAKGLSFGGRRHEAERFWEKKEGSMCMQCCGRDHLGKCAEVAKCYICAGDHEGSEHQCAAEGCGKKSEPCEHHMAKCANCGGAHVATSRKCHERFSSRQIRARNAHQMRSSPPLMDTESITEGQARKEGQEQTDRPQPNLEQSGTRHDIPILSDMSVDDCLPEE